LEGVRLEKPPAKARGGGSNGGKGKSLPPLPQESPVGGLANGYGVAIGGYGAELRGHGMVPAISLIPCANDPPVTVKGGKDAAGVAVAVVGSLEK